jgi:UDP-N-acetylglucosamine--N-acetylmuramyl-(pentapeptide) pyrophosphoryl-undecaprenol N-acetylglucosamine transferase
VHETRVVVFAGGGTGGHLYPAFAMAEALCAERPDVRPFFMGAERGIEREVLRERGLPHLLLPLRGVVRGNWLANLGLGSALAVSLVRTADAFQRLRPEMVVLTGGYAAASAGMVAAARGLPLVLQEPNAWPGMVTRMLAPWADQIHVAYPEVIERLRFLHRGAARVTGHPVRAFAPVDAQEAVGLRAGLGLQADRDIVLATGGSQGSAAINDLLVDACLAVRSGALTAPDDWQLLWATGTRNHASVTARLGDLLDAEWLTVLPYIDDMPGVLPMARVAVGRSGAGTTAEFQLSGTPSVLIPLPTSAENHQEHNARALVDAGAALLLRQADASPQLLWEMLSDLMADPERCDAMSEAARGRARPTATQAIGRDLAVLLDRVSGRRSGRHSGKGSGRVVGSVTP